MTNSSSSPAPTAPPGDRQNLLWVDSHCHIDLIAKAQEGGEVDLVRAQAVLDAALDQGVGHFLCVSVDLAKFDRMRSCVDLSPRVACSAGIHPSADEQRKDAVWQRELESLLADETVVAVGETGLDYHYDTIARSVQQSRYAAHIQLASETTKPLIIHTREARADTIALLKSEGAGAVTGVMHCFTETWEMAKQALDLGFYISFSGIITFKNAAELREVVARVPMDRILVETDSPYLAPVPFRGKQNQPAHVAWVGQKIAEIKGLSVEAVAQYTTENYFELFKHVSRQPAEAVN